MATAKYRWTLSEKVGRYVCIQYICTYALHVVTLFQKGPICILHFLRVVCEKNHPKTGKRVETAKYRWALPEKVG